MGNWSRWGLDEGEVVLERGRILQGFRNGEEVLECYLGDPEPDQVVP